MSQQERIAILSTACRFPNANSGAELWTNATEGRRSFRTIPKQRLDISRYLVDAIGEPDSITPIRAGLLTNWQVDRDKLRIPKQTFEATDLTHWLALELATEAIAAIGGINRLDRSRTAVIVANTLTGEFSRTSLLRLRAPFLDDLLTDAAEREAVPTELTARLRASFGAELRRRLTEPNEDSLAGGLANTIAGRIANYFDLGGGAYSVDAACASSLVALADASTLLISGQIDAAVVAAVDLSLDPFELVGFSRNSALAVDEMRVFDARANGFWPGEGGACAVLMRDKDAARQNFVPQAYIRGWGLSSDGAGGLTRPSIKGQLSAYQRAYRTAGVDPNDLAFVEAHGTGTAIGDPIEVRALAALREGARSSLPIGSIKANIGHTKAAAGFAGLIKVIEALRHGFIPPHVSCQTVHPVFADVNHCIHPSVECKSLEVKASSFMGVSSFGFGGINAHLVIEGTRTTASRVIMPSPPVEQDAELFLFAGHSIDEVVTSIATMESRAPSLSIAELADAAAQLASKITSGHIRAAIVASCGTELASRLGHAKFAITSGRSVTDRSDGIFIGHTSHAPRIGFLFPGQGASVRSNCGIWQSCFADDVKLTELLPPLSGQDSSSTQFVQPRIVAASLAGISVIERLGISACVAVGHSLGEVSALTWAGVLNPDDALGLAIKRGTIMATLGVAGGSMLRVVLPTRDALQLAKDTGTVVACRNGGAEVVLSGSADAISIAAARCNSLGIDATRLAVSHAFHSPHMGTAMQSFAAAIHETQFNPLTDRVMISTVSGEELAPGANIQDLLINQLIRPVLFDAALEILAEKVDLLVEIGPGQGLTRLAKSFGATAFSIDVFSDSIKPLLTSVAAIFAAGTDIHANELFKRRNIRPIDLVNSPRYIESPCGSKASTEDPLLVARPATPKPARIATQIIQDPPANPPVLAVSLDCDTLGAVLCALAQETDLRPDRIGPDDRFLDTLHLNSLSVTRVVVAAAKMLKLRIPLAATEFANATARQVAEALNEIQLLGHSSADHTHRVAGVRPWVRPYAMEWIKAPLRCSDHVTIQWTGVTLSEQIPSDFRGNCESGLSICIDGEFDHAAAVDLVALAGKAARLGVRHLALCHRGAPLSAFARSISREGHFQSVRVIDRAHFDANDARIGAVLSESIIGFDEVRLEANGGLTEPVFVPSKMPSWSHTEIQDESDDVVVIVGGGKGIAAECALRIGRRGATIILVGRSPSSEPDVAATLMRAAQSGVRCHYLCADVLNSPALSAGLAQVLATTGPATMLVYAPAINEPGRLIDLEINTVLRTLAPKTLGLQSALHALGSTVRRLITFGSIIGRIGLEGECHYALANAMQTAASEAWAETAPGRTSLAIEWSVWAGVGMGERLGTLERMAAQGVDAISLDDALAAFDKLIAMRAQGTIAITSRFGPPPGLSLGRTDLPMLRFIDNPLVFFPGTELVVETTLSHGRDPYLKDHIVNGQTILPAVIGLEAMAQVASALAPIGPHIVVSEVEFCRALHVPTAGDSRIRISALHHVTGSTEVILFASDDDFLSPCVRATFSPGGPAPPPAIRSPEGDNSFAAYPLYGPLFFHGQHFRRLEFLDAATSRQVIARLRPTSVGRWFGAYQANTLILGDPGANDAILHALQVAVPHRRVLPVRVARIDIDTTASQISSICAYEKSTIEQAYTFDIRANDSCNLTAQRWTDITFRAVDRTDIGPVLVASPQLIPSYLERTARELFLDDSVAVAFVQSPLSSREQRREMAISRLNLRERIERRSDGRPVLTEGKGSVSIAHARDATLAVTAQGIIGCDIEAVDAKLQDLEQVTRHVIYEACRKVGRKPSLPALGQLIAGVVSYVEDVQVVTIELPLASGLHIAAIGRLHRPSPPPTIHETE